MLIETAEERKSREDESKRNSLRLEKEEYRKKKERKKERKKEDGVAREAETKVIRK